MWLEVGNFDVSPYRLVINLHGEGGGGLQNGEVEGLKRFVTPPQDRVTPFATPLLKSGNFLRPTSIWQELKANM